MQVIRHNCKKQRALSSGGLSCDDSEAQQPSLEGRLPKQRKGCRKKPAASDGREISGKERIQK